MAPPTELAADQVHICVADLGLADVDVQRLAAMLRPAAAPARSEIIEGGPPGRWTLQALAPAVGHVAAVAAQGWAWCMRCLRW